MTYTITVERPARDRFGNPVTPPPTHTIDDCWDAPAGTGDIQGRSAAGETGHLSDIVEWDLDLLGPYGADLKPDDVVKIPGDDTRYQVYGRPNRWKGPDGWEAGSVTRLKAATG